MSDEREPKDPGCVQPPPVEPDLIQQVADELEAAGVLMKTGKQREGCDVYVLVPGKTHADYVAWKMKQRSKG